MSERYIQACARIDWLLEQVERALEITSTGAPITVEFVQAAGGDRLATYDEAEACRAALEEMTVLRREGDRLILDRQPLVATEGYRRGVREGLRYADMTRALEPALCVAVPPGLASEAESRLRREAVDLRLGLFDLLASARRRIVIGCPFWDHETAQEVSSILARRLAAGVSVDVLMRGAEDPAIGLIERLGRDSPSLRLFSWYEAEATDRFGVRTFHFKAVVADDERAYLGSANLTTGGLRSRLELGVLLAGDAARRLGKILDIVLGVARRV